MHAEVKLGNVMVDCGDERALCEFYHGLLGWQKSARFGRPALTSTNGTVIMFIEEEDYAPPVWPEQPGMQQKQLHFDFVVPNVAAAVARALALGAKRPAAQFGGGEEEFVTLLNPAGHPFCLCAEGNEA